MAANPKISVCIPVYNREKYIAQCIESVLAQDYKNIEIIISDNCSMDGTVEIVNRYLFDKRIRFYQNETNVGAYLNFEKLLYYALGEWFIFLSSDDYWLDTSFLSNVIEKINLYKDLTMICGGKIYINEGSNYVQNLSDNTDSVYDGREIFLGGLDTWTKFEFGAIVFKISFLKEAFSFGFNLPGDDVFIFWYICLKGKLYILRKPFLIYRNHNNNMCRWKSLEDFVQRIIINALVPIKIYNIIIKNDIFNKIIIDKWLIKNILLFMTASGYWNFDNLCFLRNSYHDILIKNGYSLDDFGLENLFDKIKNIYYLQSKLYDNDTYNKNKNSIKHDLELIGNFYYDKKMKDNLIKCGIDKKNLDYFFDVFIYSNVFNYTPVELKNLNFIEKKLIGYMDKLDNDNISDLNSDISGKGWILNNEDMLSPDKVYMLLIQNNYIKYYISTTLFERLDVVKQDNTFLSVKCGFSFVIPSHAILSGTYSYMILFVKDNYASILETNKILELSSQKYIDS